MIRPNRNWNRWWTFVTISVIALAVSSGAAYGLGNFVLCMILIFFLGADLGTFITYVIMKDAEDTRYVDRRYPKGFDNERQNLREVKS